MACSFATRSSRPAASRTCATEPGADARSSAHSVWMESTTATAGCSCTSVWQTTSRSVSAITPMRPAPPMRSARIRTCAGDSSPHTSSTGCRGGEPRQRHRGERRLADARVAADQHQRARDEPAAEHAIELVDAGGQPVVARRLDVGQRLRAAAGRLPATAAPRRPAGRAASSTIEPTRCTLGQRPCHLGWAAPHSWQTNWVFVASMGPAHDYRSGPDVARRRDGRAATVPGHARDRHHRHRRPGRGRASTSSRGPSRRPARCAFALAASSLNHADLWASHGQPRIERRFPFVLGVDGAGTIDAVGAGVDDARIGSDVVVNPVLSCGHCAQCVAGERMLCRDFQMIGEHVDGTHADAICVPAICAVPRRPALSAGGGGRRRDGVRDGLPPAVTRAGACVPGERVLIHGIGGGLGTAALQLAKVAGAEVAVTSSDDAKLERARALGADHVVNYRSGDVVREVRAAIGAADVVVDSVGAAVWEASFRLLAQGGRLVNAGATGGDRGAVPIVHLFWRQLELIGTTMATDAEFRRALDLMVTVRSARRRRPHGGAGGGAGGAARAGARRAVRQDRRDAVGR